MSLSPKIDQIDQECMKYDILQKVAMSKCNEKAKYLIDKIMHVRHKASANKYYFHNGHKSKKVDLTQQDKEIYKLSQVVYFSKFKLIFQNLSQPFCVMFLRIFNKK